MTKIPIVDAKTMEKVLFRLGFKKVNKKEATSFTAILMVGLLPFPIILVET